MKDSYQGLSTYKGSGIVLGGQDPGTSARQPGAGPLEGQRWDRIERTVHVLQKPDSFTCSRHNSGPDR